MLKTLSSVNATLHKSTKACMYILLGQSTDSEVRPTAHFWPVADDLTGSSGFILLQTNLLVQTVV